VNRKQLVPSVRVNMKSNSCPSPLRIFRNISTKLGVGVYILFLTVM